MNKKAIVNAGKEKARLISRVSSIEDEGCGRARERERARAREEKRPEIGAEKKKIFPAQHTLF